MPEMEILDNSSEMDILIEYDGEFGEFYEVPSAVKSVNGKTGDVVLDAEDVGAIETESDPVFVNSPAYHISAEDIDSWDSKSDFSGDYNDLANKPTIPSQASDVHALPDDTTYVSSVNGRTGAVTGLAEAWTVQNMTSSDTTVTLQTGTFYVFPEMSTLTVTVTAVGMYAFRFTSGTTATTLTVNGATMPDSFTVETSKVYEVNVFQGYAVVQSWS